MRKKVKILGVIGDPISHSLSPLMHNAALAHLRLPYLYLPFRVTKHSLARFLSSIPEQGIAGLNVTIPLKQAVIPHLHTLSKEAQLMGAVNTILVKRGRLIGTNTDGAGYIESLKKEAGFQVKGKRIILLGAGGAARALAIALGLAPAKKIHIVNRTLDRALKLKQELSRKLRHVIWSVSQLGALDTAAWQRADLVVNASSIGMKGIPLPDLPFENLPRKALVSDIVYHPLETPFLKQAKRSKLRVHPGWGMLLYQGALSFQLWTGRKAPVTVMKKALLSALMEKK